jgi:uncharacterized BrkB/YihY/UPF0761 family membrane protein
MLITCGGPDSDLVERDPTFGVLLAIVFPELLELEIPWLDDLSKMRSKLFETPRGGMLGVILDATHVLMGLAVISTTSDVTMDVVRRKTMTEIARRVLVDLLISITAMIVVVVTMTSTTFLSALIADASTATTAAAAITTATTMWGIGWGRIVAMLATWML